jgi:hypothetical protein
MKCAMRIGIGLRSSIRCLNLFLVSLTGWVISIARHHCLGFTGLDDRDFVDVLIVTKCNPYDYKVPKEIPNSYGKMRRSDRTKN